MNFSCVFPPRVFLLRAPFPCCMRSVGGREGSWSKGSARIIPGVMPWEGKGAAALPRSTEGKHRGLKLLNPPPFPAWSSSLILSGSPCPCPRTSPSCGTPEWNQPFSTDSQFSNETCRKGGKSKIKAAPTAHPNFIKGSLNSHFTFLAQNISAAASSAALGRVTIPLLFP